MSSCNNSVIPCDTEPALLASERKSPASFEERICEISSVFGSNLELLVKKEEKIVEISSELGSTMRIEDEKNPTKKGAVLESQPKRKSYNTH